MTAGVLYPGSFDPLHLGHLDVIQHSLELFGSVIVATLHNPSKSRGMFTLVERMSMIEQSVAGFPKHRCVHVAEFSGLAVDAAREFEVGFIVKSLRNGADFEVEQQMAHTNYAASGVRTVFLPCKPSLGFVSSRYIREIAAHGGDVSSLVPAPVLAHLQRASRKSRAGDGAA